MIKKTILLYNFNISNFNIFMHIKKNIIITVLLLIILTSCQRKAIINTHGISYLEEREKLILSNKSNKNDVIAVLGQPATKGMRNNNIWIYIERTQTKGKFLKLGKIKLIKLSVY